MTAITPARPAAYARVRSPGRDEPQMIEQERVHLLSSAKDLGWPVPVVYLDIGVCSGPAMSQLAAAIRSGRCDGVMVDMLSQLSSKPADLVTFLDLCDSHEVTVYNGTGVLPVPALRLLRGVAAALSAWHTASADTERAARTGQS